MEESGFCFDVEEVFSDVEEDDYNDGDLSVAVLSIHVFLVPTYFNSKNFVKGRKYTAKFKFLCVTIYPEDHDDDDIPWSSDEIIKCGVFPLFRHRNIA